MPSHSFCRVVVHLVWATEGRARVLPQTFDGWLARFIVAKSREVGCAVDAVGNAEDHVHVVARLAPATSVAGVVQRFKGASAFAANQRRLLPKDLVWQRGYWAESVAPDELTALRHYVEAQRVRHDERHRYDAWVRARPWRA